MDKAQIRIFLATLIIALIWGIGTWIYLNISDQNFPSDAKNEYYIIRIGVADVKVGIADFSILKLSRDGDIKEDIFSGNIAGFPAWWNLVQEPPKISPNGKYLYITNVGIFDLGKRTLIKDDKITSCAWFPDSMKLGCIEETIDSVGNITLLDIDGSKETLWEETRPYESLSPDDLFYGDASVIGIRNSNELLFSWFDDSADRIGFAKFSIPDRKLSWIYRPKLDAEPGDIWAVYSQALDKFIFVTKIDRGLDWSINSGEERWLSSLIAVGLNTSKVENLWSKPGFNLLPELLFLSQNQKKAVFQTGGGGSLRDVYTYNIVDLTTGNISSIGYMVDPQKVMNEPVLLGFTLDEKGVVLFEHNSKIPADVLFKQSTTPIELETELSLGFMYEDYSIPKKIITEDCIIDFSSTIQEGLEVLEQCVIRYTLSRMS